MIYTSEDWKFVEKEFVRMHFNKDARWRISDINKDFQLCDTYPRFFIIPASFKDDDLVQVAKFRYFRRIPSAVWRHTKNGCFIVRSSQPTVGWFGWFRSELDENLVQSYVNNTMPLTSDQSVKSDDNNGASSNEQKTLSFDEHDDLNNSKQQQQSQEQQDQQQQQEADEEPNELDDSVYVNSSKTRTKMLIIDARSYAAAMANRAKGGGCECSDYYQRCEVQFMNLANIHSIRRSFQAIGSVCEVYSEQSNNWLNFLDNSRWLHHIAALLKSAVLIVDTIDVEEKSILIHCSDGWDRTPQLVALAEIMLDSHYRTLDGFRTLIQREWLDFGHKFADRCGSNPCNEDPNERCPVFLQWLDCVQQLLVQFPRYFEFNSLYLDKLNRHTFSNVFGTFSYNSAQERILSRVDDKNLSLWSYFDSCRRKFRNHKYIKSDDILRPSYKIKDLYFWREVYLQ